jgi:ribosomal protein L30E
MKDKILTMYKNRNMQKNLSWDASSCSATQSIPWLLHNTSVHYNFHHSLTHTLSPNSFGPPIFCSHIYSSLNNIATTAHMFSAFQTTCGHNKMGDKRSETLTNDGKPNLMYQSENCHKQHPMKLQTSPNLSQTTHIKFEQPNIKLGGRWKKQPPS